MLRVFLPLLLLIVSCFLGWLCLWSREDVEEELLMDPGWGADRGTGKNQTLNVVLKIKNKQANKRKERDN